MTPRVLYATLWMLGAPATGFAQQCTADDLAQPVPGATQVSVRFADVPSARFPGVWQEGMLLGYWYKIFPNGQAVLGPKGDQPSWHVDLSCAEATTGCTQNRRGQPPADVDPPLEILERCLLGPVSRAPAQQTATPDGAGVSQTPPAKDTPPEVATPPVVASGDCAAAQVPAGGAAFTLQRLLVRAGADPGPIDGLIGASTRAALRAILGPSRQDLQLPQAIALLRQKICATQ